ncbi:SMI1/KNR4 family protein [Streptomyces sp. NPDC051211]|uniref:SMI1/KNR4 family protein n=1 Tax=Streptomyces sp. NPDC051211 TaxID=3154643 RepID=UPI00344EAD5F
MTDIEQLLHDVAAKAPLALPFEGSSLRAPATAEEVARAEAALGFTLPPLLVSLYTRVADGGFGPEGGLFPLLDDTGRGPSAVSSYLARRSDGQAEDGWDWPEGVLPIVDWGCYMLACVDCRDGDAAVLLFEPNAAIPEFAWYVDAPGFAGWLRAWLDGSAWYCNAGDEEEEMAPWPHYAARTGR